MNRSPSPAFEEWQARNAHRLVHQPAACIWPKCPKRPGLSYPELPLCDAHIQIVCQRVKAVKDQALADMDARIAANKAAAKLDREAMPGWIYYVKIGEHIKIGYASRLQARLNAYPPTSALLAAHRGTRDDEAELHRRFKLYRVAGREWYGDARELRQHIAQVLAEHGAPKSDPFTPRQNRPRGNGTSLNGTGPQIRPRSKWRGGGRVV